MIVALSTWTLRLLAVLLVIAAAVNAFMIGIFTFRIASVFFYAVALITVFFGIFGKLLSKRPGWYFLFALPVLALLAGIAVYSSLEKQAAVASLVAKSAANAPLHQYLFSWLEGVVAASKCTVAGECEDMAGKVIVWLINYVKPESDSVTCQNHENFNKVWCLLEKGCYQLFAYIWSITFWLVVAIGTLILLQSLAPLRTALRKYL